MPSFYRYIIFYEQCICPVIVTQILICFGNAVNKHGCVKSHAKFCMSHTQSTSYYKLLIKMQLYLVKLLVILVYYCYSLSLRVLSLKGNS